LTSPSEHNGRVYDVTGPESLTFGEVADRLSGALGAAIAHVAPPLDAVAAGLADAGAPEWQQRHVVELMTIFATDRSVARVTPDFDRVTGRPPATVDRFIADHKAVFGK
jgi:uncharacterized protein YbjT (DUF2867 family)